MNSKTKLFSSEILNLSEVPNGTRRLTSHYLSESDQKKNKRFYKLISEINSEDFIFNENSLSKNYLNFYYLILILIF